MGREGPMNAERGTAKGAPGGHPGGALVTALVLWGSLAVGMGACGDRPDATPGSDAPGGVDAESAPSAVPATDEQALAIGRDASAALVNNLLGALRPALDSLGAVGAVSFCSREALDLTGGTAFRAGDGVEIKRTSRRVRNPANAPDDLEDAALTHFQETMANTGSYPEEWIQRSDGEVRYYKPLFVAEFCLQCHGAPGQLAEGVPEILADLYPGDQAVGYGTGDFRGLIRVTVPPAEGVPGR